LQPDNGPDCSPDSRRSQVRRFAASLHHRVGAAAHEESRRPLPAFHLEVVSGCAAEGVFHASPMKSLSTFTVRHDLELPGELKIIRATLEAPVIVDFYCGSIGRSARGTP
jgi:hypothetical protein